jgi:hypothetical protein
MEGADRTSTKASRNNSTLQQSALQLVPHKPLFLYRKYVQKGQTGAENKKKSNFDSKLIAVCFMVSVEQ